MSQIVRDDDVRREVVIQITESETRRFRQRTVLSGVALTASDLGVRASGDIVFSLVQDAQEVVLVVRRSDFNFAELRFIRSSTGLVPKTPVKEKTFAEWFGQISTGWHLG